MLEKFRHWYRILPDKKRYLEFVTALLTIPVLLTVIYTNMVSIREDKKSNTTPTPEKSEKIVIIREDENKENEKSNTPTPIPTLELSPTQSTKECKKEVRPVKISIPSEKTSAQEDLICINIDSTV